MIKVYGMPSCPDCVNVERQIAGREDEFEFINIGKHVRYMKEFIRMRDGSSVFDDCRKNGSIGIPAFVFEDGHISLDPVDAGLKSNVAPSACSIEDHKSGRKGC